MPSRVRWSCVGVLSTGAGRQHRRTGAADARAEHGRRRSRAGPAGAAGGAAARGAGGVGLAGGRGRAGLPGAVRAAGYALDPAVALVLQDGGGDARGGHDGGRAGGPAVRFEPGHPRPGRDRVRRLAAADGERRGAGGAVRDRHAAAGVVGGGRGDVARPGGRGRRGARGPRGAHPRRAGARARGAHGGDVAARGAAGRAAGDGRHADRGALRAGREPDRRGLVRRVPAPGRADGAGDRRRRRARRRRGGDRGAIAQRLAGRGARGPGAGARDGAAERPRARVTAGGVQLGGVRGAGPRRR